MIWHVTDLPGFERAERAQMTSSQALIAAEDATGDFFVFLEENGKRTEIYSGFLDMDEARELMLRHLQILSAAEWMLTAIEYGNLLEHAWPDGCGAADGLDRVADMIEGFSDELPQTAAVKRKIAELRERERQVAA